MRRAPRSDRGDAITTTVVAVIIVIIAAIWGLTAWLGSYTKTQGGVVAVVRNGGPLDNNKVRQVIPPGSSRTYRGYDSQVHKYPSQQRYYTITADKSRGDRTGVDIEYHPSSDGVEVGVEGTIYFTLNTDLANCGTRPITDKCILAKFDNLYGTRTYRGLDGKERHAWDGEDGWRSFLDVIVRPVISNDLREQIGDFKCAELQSSCALVQYSSISSTPGQQNAITAVQAAAGQNNANLQRIQDAINASLKQDLNETLHGPFLTDISFRLSHVSLPPKVQAAIESAQAAFAQVTEAQAEVAKANAAALANENRQRGYEKCPACAVIDELKAIPPSVTTFAPGAGFAVTPGGK